ncbi:MAG: NADAR family protein [Bacteroidota bacterium]
MKNQKLTDQEIISSNLYYVRKRDGLDWNFEERLFNEYKSLGGVIRKRIEQNGGEEQFMFFWKTESPFSQWHQSRFEGSLFSFVNKALLPDEFSQTYEFSSAEQFMMFNKALLFLDRKVAAEIMKTNDPRQQKELGRQVKNFDPEIWEYARSEIVFAGNKMKFNQNEDLKQALLATVGTTLVEASPYDQIWGVGLSANEETIQSRKSWNGLNLLGEILTEIREEMIRKER